ncbi:DUF3054 domain-containing protein [Rhodococcus triatomae]|uniref:DUF3054 domain-containing protein n=1 Tax=Rhodococcus triatomae TaxID=300028 RepID=A0A1G8GPM4_9NOCA|nr:DUF3054 domain-containing protein [Rhodococcus triatomae]QNG20329.1 DUF3054 domain-containing protein [Rhodococcus triatomae]QNG23755.1 DUF3054 domain-containing protein [Rhodococcus triatomae]SDH96329.1 Protein of unknown function [Rhodococcus triatomae]
MKKQWFLALAADVVVVIVFAAIGRRSHGEATALAGLATTAWPFLTGLAIGWAATFALYRDKFDAYLVVPTGILVWLSTLVVGMLARVISGQGTAFSFILVAGTFLALFLVGWRAVFRLIESRTGPAR